MILLGEEAGCLALVKKCEGRKRNLPAFVDLTDLLW
jgi:hypothetical protein